MTRNYSRWRHATERFQDAIFRESWPAALVDVLAPASFRVWHERVSIGKSLGTASQLRVAFAADFHAGPLTPSSSIARACDAIAAARPDVVLLGGDFVSIAARHLDRVIEPLQAVSAPLGVFAVLGNHDHWAGSDVVTQRLERAGVILLTNRSHALPEPFAGTLLVGLDDHGSGYPDASGPRWDAAAATILLIHQPSGLLDAAGRPFDVALAGHTHGGQIVLPGGYAPVVPHGRLSRRYVRGRHVVGPAHLLVTVGVGNSSLPVRVGTTPEIVVCDIVSDMTSAST